MGLGKEGKITQERLRELLDYDPDTGVFLWKVGRRAVKAGQRAGSIDKNGYRYIKVEDKFYLAQRLAWFWVNGVWPGFLRFEDSNTDNCAISNLRDSAYVRSKDSKYDWRTKEGKAAQQREYRATIVDQLRDKRLRDDFGIDLTEYNRMHAAQGGVCAICGKSEAAKRNGKLRWLAVDHCHSSNKVRGLLCGNCNPMIGYAKDSVEVLGKAIEYLNSYKGAA